METFLTWIGAYNTAGALALMEMHDPRVGDLLLRRATQVVAEEYLHGP